MIPMLPEDHSVVLSGCRLPMVKFARLFTDGAFSNFKMICSEHSGLASGLDTMKGTAHPALPTHAPQVGFACPCLEALREREHRGLLLCMDCVRDWLELSKAR